MIEVLDSYFAKKDILRKYTYAQYVDCFRDVGTFEIHAQLIDENLYILDRTEQYYVLFYDGNKPIIGKIDDAKRESDEQYDTVIKLTGRLAPVLFTQRVVNGTQKFSGKTYQRVKELVTSNLIQSDKAERNVNITINLLNESIMQRKASQEDKQVTGGYVWDEMQSSLETDSFGIDFYPVLSTPTGENKTNITSWVLDISPGNDRRKGNTEGNTPVVFSQQLSNIERTDYERNVKDYRNVAYVAGEGEESKRKWYEVEINQNIEQKVLTGWGRKELWIDARDIQSENEEGTKLTDKEYEALIMQRANEKASENTVQETYEATKTESDKRYKYGVDFSKGDWVTVEDRNLNIVVDAQITEVIHTIQGSREIVDITFSYGQINKDPVKQIANTKELAEKNDNNIKYLEKKLGNNVFNLSYETSEVKTGEVWIDGKPIYRKVFQVSAIESKAVTINHNISNANIVWVDTSHSFLLVGNNTYSLPRIGNSINQCVGVQATRSTFTISAGSDANFSGGAIVTLLYTKNE